MERQKITRNTTRKVDQRILESFDEDPGYENEPWFDPNADYEISNTDYFNKYFYKQNYPTKIAKELKPYFPEFKIKHHQKLRKMVGQSAYFHGQPGTGKTFSAIALLLMNAKDEKWRPLFTGSKFYRVPDIFNRLRNLINRKDEIDTDTAQGLTLYDSFIEQLSTCRHLILDDLGTERATDWTHEIFNTIIDERYNRGRITIVTSNMSPTKIIQNNEYNRVMSRLMDMVGGKVIELTTPYRETAVENEKW